MYDIIECAMTKLMNDYMKADNRMITIDNYNDNL
jgi:hypothetical protein